MKKEAGPEYSRTVIEFVAAANEFTKYAEQATGIPGSDLIRILQRILPLMYIKASLLPVLTPVFEEGNEKFVTEEDYNRIREGLLSQLGSTDIYFDLSDYSANDPDIVIRGSLSEDISDIYQDIKNFLLLYQTGTTEVMNDAVWECKTNFESYWGQKLLNSLRAMHKLIYSGDPVGEVLNPEQEEGIKDTSEWFISRRQKEYKKNGR
jgi:hypothetical protein